MKYTKFKVLEQLGIGNQATGQIKIKTWSNFGGHVGVHIMYVQLEHLLS